MVPGRDRFLFSHAMRAKGSICFRWDADGMNIVQLTNNDFEDCAVVISPEGKLRIRAETGRGAGSRMSSIVA